MDAGSSGVADSAKQLMEQLEQAQELQQEGAQGAQEGTGDMFQQSLQTNTELKTQDVSQVQATQEAGKSRNVLTQATLVEGNNPITQVGATQKAQSSQLKNALNQVSDGQAEMTKLLKGAMSGKKMGMQELLGMQMKVFQLTQQLDITSKVVSKTTDGIKQTMSTQV